MVRRAHRAIFRAQAALRLMIGAIRLGKAGSFDPEGMPLRQHRGLRRWDRGALVMGVPARDKRPIDGLRRPVP
ncbi:hypothetical protein GCM10007388_38570 [Pseudoduganella plicata]|uniref:Uncharacterized protein n=1 Tax=Pseudoduganella plicata TaxID=321984 RepID=A0AA88CDQ4_9BURK|nr:hypothetical protein GCM10007388_38570 [Pseudoduganella plicata]